jgi:hypothetical protein
LGVPHNFFDRKEKGAFAGTDEDRISEDAEPRQSAKAHAGAAGGANGVFKGAKNLIGQTGKTTMGRKRR